MSNCLLCLPAVAGSLAMAQKLFHFPPPDHPMGGPGGLPPLMMATISACQHFSFQLLLPVALCFVFLYMAFVGGGR